MSPSAVRYRLESFVRASWPRPTSSPGTSQRRDAGGVFSSRSLIRRQPVPPDFPKNRDIRLRSIQKLTGRAVSFGGAHASETSHGFCDPWDASADPWDVSGGNVPWICDTSWRKTPSDARLKHQNEWNELAISTFHFLRMGVRFPPGGKRRGPEVKKVRLRGCCRLFAPLSCGSPCARLPPRTSHSPLALHFLWLRPSLATPRESEEKLRFSSLSSRLALTLHP